jgi:RimJ/RimL family protein N-acetyltransferase
MAWDLAPRLTGERVVLTPLAPAHYDALFAAAQHPEIWTWWPLNPGADPLAFRRWFDGALHTRRQGSESHFATIDARTGRALGSTSFCTPRPEDRGLEIGWTWLTPAAWSTGANTEAKLLQLGYAFEALGCIRVEFETDEQNARSRRALAALPATFEGVWRDWRLVGERRASSAFYSILDTEWPAVRANLERRLDALKDRGPGAMPGPR